MFLRRGSFYTFCGDTSNVKNISSNHSVCILDFQRERGHTGDKNDRAKKMERNQINRYTYESEPSVRFSAKSEFMHES